MSFQLTPLNEDQFKQFKELHNSLDEKQLFWIAGYLAGVLGSNSTESAKSVTDSGKSIEKVELTILYGSRTGNGEGLAKIIAQQAVASGMEVKIKNLATYKVRDIVSETNILIIASTHGEGEPPFETKEFYDYLHGKRAPKLANLCFTVLGLGDSSYVNFCKTAKDFNLRLEELGAKRIHDPAYLDVDFKSKYAFWTESALKSFAPNLDLPHLPMENGVDDSKFTSQKPFKAKLLDKIQLYGRGAGRKVYHIELETNGLQFQAGDALGVLPVNKDEKVEEILKLLSLDANTVIGLDGNSIDLFSALKYKFEISKLTPDVLNRYLSIFPIEKLKKISENSAALSEFIKTNDLTQFLMDYKPEIDANQLLSILRPLQARLYSISSSSAALPGEIHLTVGLLAYELKGRKLRGVCSDYLANLEEDAEISVFVESNENFRLPAEPHKPIIMIGAGTGIAPFRAFVQERELQKNAGKSWLFFGNRNFETEFLYQTEWHQALASGSLTKLDLAFSRDGVQKCYVQHKLIENASEVYQWLMEGASVYVCGDKSKLAGDVQTAIKQIIQSHAHLTDEDTETYFLQLIKEKRYQTDVY